MNNSNEPVYNEEHAKRYNNTWFNNDVWEPEKKQHIDTLRSLLSENTKWLDAGCGTGYFLSCFPEIKRAGFDSGDENRRRPGYERFGTDAYRRRPRDSDGRRIRPYSPGTNGALRPTGKRSPEGHKLFGLPEEVMPENGRRLHGVYDACPGG